MSSSQFVLGTAQLGSAYGLANKEGKLSPEKAFKVLDEAILRGVRIFDTASGYGDSEEIIGNYFQKNPGVETIEVITKVCPLILDEHTSIESAVEQTDISIHQSLEKLRVDSIQNLFFHRYDNMMWRNGFLLNYVQGLPSIQSIGVSVYTPEQALIAMDMDGISAIQLPTNLLDLRFLNEGVFETANKKGIKIYIRSIYLQGLILMELDRIPHHLKAATPYLQKLRNICPDIHQSLSELTLSFLKAIQESPLIVIGCETTSQVHENAHMVNSIPKLNSDLYDVIRKEMSQAPDHIINPSLWKS